MAENNSRYICPPFLKPGDKAVIVSPAGCIDPQFVYGAARRMESWGLEVEVAPHACGEHFRFSGTRAERLADLQQALDRPDVALILCSRGGYGAIQIACDLDFGAFSRRPKWLAGYSDITLLHAAFQAHGYMSLHCHMARHLALCDDSDPDTGAMRSLLFGSVPVYTVPVHRLNRTGSCRGILRGGNLAVLGGLRGTPLDLPEGNDTVLFIEDIGERPYRIDRLMYNLRTGGVLERLAGLIVGTFCGYEDDLSMGCDVCSVISDAVSDYGFPVCFGFPVGHEGRNVPLVCGSAVSLEVDNSESRLKISV